MYITSGRDNPGEIGGTYVWAVGYYTGWAPSDGSCPTCTQPGDQVLTEYWITLEEPDLWGYTFTFIDSYGDGLLASQNAGVQVYEGCGDLSCSEAHWESPEDAVLHESPEEVLGL